MTKSHAGTAILLAASLGWSQPHKHKHLETMAGNQGGMQEAALSPDPGVSSPPQTMVTSPSQAGPSNPASSNSSLTPQEAARKRLHKPAPLQRLNFSARQGFSLRLVGNEQVTAEIKNGAGRTLARGNYALEAGDWKLHPRNLPPGLYTVLLRTGAQLRSMRMKIEDSERGHGSPEWVLEKSTDASAAEPASIPPGSRLSASAPACPA